jgi:hypothetical protein
LPTNEDEQIIGSNFLGVLGDSVLEDEPFKPLLPAATNYLYIRANHYIRCRLDLIDQILRHFAA